MKAHNILFGLILVALAVAGLRPLPPIDTNQLHTEDCQYLSEGNFYMCPLDPTAPAYANEFTSCQNLDNEVAFCFK
jgi:hypothetical protein